MSTQETETMTEDQLALLELHELILPAHVEGENLSIEDRFLRFHHANPWLLEAYAQLARQYAKGGAQRVSVNMLTEVLRYSHGRVRGDEPWRINNSFRSHYARLLIATYPEFDGLFETRAMPSLRRETSA
jgi:hypothetical protein